MATIQRFEEIEAWKTARELTKAVYQVSNAGDFARDFGLRDQMRRASVSILSNIAEGFESRTKLMFLEYLGRAKASCGELRAQLYVALDANHIPQNIFGELFGMAEKCSRQLSNFMAYIKKDIELSTKVSLRESNATYAVRDDFAEEPLNFPTFEQNEE